ncbi:NAD-dependent epimerase/dehydratase family protein [Rhodobacteraceae bacterium RKSG542]|uniref:NAD-dependent epimerase/dehydratase family protein n=1 Tax=Pseudovibrio flavus TaxID=2529854 RepID=UPI0012BCDF5A|nr:NAD-dependent epimerase/dehydratase family protein [Pseudovibrio flavus]MTI16498.1 NAD-dependent epimerase/dehydratase family protein [Pseudovibrio flavus]
MKFFITGTAGFIGYHLARRLLDEGHFVDGYDGMTPYYDPRLKTARVERLERSNGYRHYVGMLEDKEFLDTAVDESQPDIIIHLAAQAGVRYSLECPEAYVSANLVGTFNVMEAARRIQPKHFLAASTSSVYGGNEKMPFMETDRADSPMTLYAATKKANEAMTHSYAHLWKIPTTCFRFFTVYGPWGRPDMALFKFVDAIENDRPIDVYGEGQMGRDFTYVDDLVEGIVRLVDAVPVEGSPVLFEEGVDSLSPVAPWRVVNIAGGQPIGLMPFIETIEKSLGKTAQKNMLPMQKGDVHQTMSDPSLLNALTGYVPETCVEEGVSAFVDWYWDYFADK